MEALLPQGFHPSSHMPYNTKAIYDIVLIAQSKCEEGHSLQQGWISQEKKEIWMDNKGFRVLGSQEPFLKGPIPCPDHQWYELLFEVRWDGDSWIIPHPHRCIISHTFIVGWKEIKPY